MNFIIISYFQTKVVKWSHNVTASVNNSASASVPGCQNSFFSSDIRVAWIVDSLFFFEFSIGILIHYIIKRSHFPLSDTCRARVFHLSTSSKDDLIFPMQTSTSTSTSPLNFLFWLYSASLSQALSQSLSLSPTTCLPFYWFLEKLPLSCASSMLLCLVEYCTL